jgi:hypothetical protein
VARRYPVGQAAGNAGSFTTNEPPKRIPTRTRRGEKPGPREKKPKRT